MKPSLSGGNHGGEDLGYLGCDVDDDTCTGKAVFLAFFFFFLKKPSSSGGDRGGFVKT